MSEPKAQLVAPVGNINAPGINATGVITASSFSGEGGIVSNLTGSPNLNVGVVTASSFVGDSTGHAAGLTGTPNVNLGVTTSTGFVGDATGKAANLTGSPNIEVGLITATTFVGGVTGNVTGNITGTASSILQGANLGVGVATASEWYGDGSALTGAGSSVYKAQEITSTGQETIIDLSDGNLIYYKGEYSTTVGFASTAAADPITFVRDTSPTYNLSVTTGAVTIAGDDDYISIPASSEYDIGTGDFTVECWVYADSLVTASHSKRPWEVGSALADSLCIRIDNDRNVQVALDNTSVLSSGNGGMELSTWTHLAVCRKSSSMTLYINGEISKTATVTTDIDKSADTFFIGANHASPSTSSWNGKISNFRYVLGTAVYDKVFTPPVADLTAISGTKILCCQSDSSATAAADSPGTLTVNGTVTAGAVTISQTVNSGTITWPDRITWNNNTIPPLVSNSRGTAGQIFKFITNDSGLTYNGWEGFEADPQTYQLWSWGYMRYGNLGHNQAGPGAYSSPVQVPGTTWSNVTEGWKAYQSGGIKSDGTLWVWGQNGAGILGQNQAPAQLTGTSSPVQIPGTTWSNAAQGGDNSSATLSVKTDGTLWGWGGNSVGNLGQNNTDARSSPVQVGTDTNWKFIRHGADYSLAVKTNGELWAWGYNLYYGAQGNNSKTEYSSPVQVPGTTWAYAGAGRPGNSIAVKTNGTLWTWGNNTNGDLGLNNKTSYSSPKQVPGTSWDSSTGSKITAGLYASLAIRTDGTLWAWGTNSGGNLGQNNTTKYSSPVQIPGTTWDSVDLKYAATLATKTDGTLWAWGSNSYGAAGQNDRTAYSSPMQIPGTWKTGERAISSRWHNTIALKAG